MNTPTSDIREILIAEMLETFGNTAVIFVEKEPSTPDKAVTVYQLPGEQGKDSVIEVETHSIRVKCRDVKGNRETAYNKIYAVTEQLHRLAEYRTSASRIIQIIQNGSIEFNGFDQNDRPAYSADFVMQRTDLI